MRQTKLTTRIGVVTVIAVLAAGIGVGIYRSITGPSSQDSSSKSDVADVRSDSTAGGSEKRDGSGSEKPSSSSALEEIDLAKEWTNLASTDETFALRALLKLSSAPPKNTVPFLKQHL